MNDSPERGEPMLVGAEPPPTPTAALISRLVAEFVGTAFLLAVVVGSGIMAQQLSSDVGLQLLENAFATAGVLAALILAFGPVSGAHFNPAVTVVDRALGGLDTATAAAYVVAQVCGAVLGVVVANLMFDLPAVTVSTRDRSSFHEFLAEAVATLGLLLVIFVMVRSRSTANVAFAVGAYIGGAYWFTSSTSFANPAVTVARTLSDTFAGIEPASVPGFLLAQAIAVAVTLGLLRLLFPAGATAAS
ncbi:MAG: aquaporin [Acidimicrobiales bacterium]